MSFRDLNLVNKFNEKYTDWVPYSGQDITAVSTDPTLGTIIGQRTMWRRQGDSIQITYMLQQDGGVSGSGNYLYPIPKGYTIDQSKLNNQAFSVVGAAWGRVASFFLVGVVQVGLAASLTMRLGSDSQTMAVAGGGGSLPMGSATEFGFFATVPILKLDSNIL